MPRQLTAFQLFNQIRKRLPGGHKKGSLIISHLVRRGYVEKIEPNGFQLKPGVKPTSEDVDKLAKELSHPDP